MKKVFDTLADIIEGNAIVVFSLLFVILGFMLKNMAFVYHVLPESMSMRLLVSCILPVGSQLIVLITTANTHLIGRWLPPVLAVLNGLMILFFVGAFEAADPLIVAQRVFIAVTSAMVEYTLAVLFVKKRRELKQIAEKQDLEQDILNLNKKLDHKKKELEQLISETNYRIEQTMALTCACGFVALNDKSLNAHKGRCITQKQV